MTSLIPYLFLLGFVALGLWIFWNLLEIVYRVVAILVLAALYTLLTVWEYFVVMPIVMIWHFVSR